MNQSIENEPIVTKNIERKFTSAMQKASQIENIINKPQGLKNTVQTSNDTTTSVWFKRQSCSNTVEATQQPPPPPQPVTSQPSISIEKTSDCIQVDELDSADSKNDVNPEEYQFFINAIEKLKATNLFHERDIKQMSDEQIYDALVEHARKQKLKQRLMAAHQLSMSTAASSSLAHPAPAFTPPNTNTGGPQLESIDAKEDEEDLPIIMKNLHSVKSLKHFFEIRAKSTAAAASLTMSQPFNNGENQPSNTNSPQLNMRSSKCDIAASPLCPPPPPPLPNATSYDMFIKSSNPLLEKCIKHGIGLANKVIQFKSQKLK